MSAATSESTANRKSVTVNRVAPCALLGGEPAEAHGQHRPHRGAQPRPGKEAGVGQRGDAGQRREHLAAEAGEGAQEERRAGAVVQEPVGLEQPFTAHDEHPPAQGGRPQPVAVGVGGRAGGDTRQPDHGDHGGDRDVDGRGQRAAAGRPGEQGGGLGGDHHAVQAGASGVHDEPHQQVHGHDRDESTAMAHELSLRDVVGSPGAAPPSGIDRLRIVTRGRPADNSPAGLRRSTGPPAARTGRQTRSGRRKAGRS